MLRIWIQIHPDPYLNFDIDLDLYNFDIGPDPYNFDKDPDLDSKFL